MPVAGVGPAAQLVQVAALGEQPGRLPGGIPVAGIGLAAQYLCGLVEVAVLG
jgi:hypothetical protein